MYILYVVTKLINNRGRFFITHNTNYNKPTPVIHYNRDGTSQRLYVVSKVVTCTYHKKAPYRYLQDRNSTGARNLQVFHMSINSQIMYVG